MVYPKLRDFCPACSLVCALLLPLAGIAAVDRDVLEDADFDKTVTIVYNGLSATVTGADAAGVTVTQGSNTSAVAITSSVAGVQYVLSGTSTAGYLQLTSTNRSKVVLNGVSLVSPDGPAVSVLTSERTFLVLADGKSNSLTDSSSYSRTGKGTIHTGGKLLLSGAGSVQIGSLGGHGIYTDSNVRVLGGTVAVTAAAKDAIHPKSAFQLDDGNLSLVATGDGVDAAGGITVNGGRIDFSTTVADVKALKTDAACVVNGGVVTATIAGDQSKGISAATGVTINGGSLFFNLSGNVVLESATTTSGTAYSDPAYCTAIKSDTDVVITGGHVVITHTGTAGKGISADGNITISNGVVDATIAGGASASYTDSTGAADTAAGDAITADGSLTITGGTIRADLQGASADGLSSDTLVSITGGSFDIKASGDQTKGLKSKAAMNLGGGTFTFTLSGNVVLEASTTSTGTACYDPSYCSGIKCDGDLTVSGGSFTITHTGTAGKGVSVDGNIAMTGGTFAITTSGGATSTYTNESGVIDIAAADCLKADGNLVVTGGTITARSTGTAGDGVSCDGAATIGTAGVDSTPVISVSTSGQHVLVSGSGMNADYANPKAFKAEGDLTMNGGSFTATTSTEGGEGMESKANLVINGGTIEINAYDDCINASSSITINGGSIYCYSSNNDGIDSNGTMKITGGTIIASGTTVPEEGFDCDANNFAITGGTLVGIGGATSTPTAASCTQRSVIYKGTGTANVVLQVRSSAGSNLVYKVPRSYAGSMTLLFSNADLSSGTTYTILSGVTVSGGTEFHGLYTGATVSGGTTLKTFTPTSMVTTVQ